MVERNGFCETCDEKLYVGIGHGADYCAAMVRERKIRDLELKNDEYKSSADLWATRWSRLKENFEKLGEENAKLLLQNGELRKALEHIADLDGQIEPITWMEAFAKAVEIAKAALAEKKDVPVPICAACRAAFPGHQSGCSFGGPYDAPE